MMAEAATDKRSGVIGAYRSLPRSARWLVVAALGIGAYFAILEPVVVATVEANARVQAMTARIRSVQAMGRQADDDMQAIAMGERMHGPMTTPGPRGERASALNRAVDSALREAGVSGARTQTIEQNLADGPATQHFGGRGSLVRLVSTVSFDASPEAFSRVLGALESSPDVAGVSRVIVRRGGDGSRTVSATLTVEAWALGAQARAGGGS